MKAKFSTACLVVSLLFAPVMVYSAEGDSASTMVKDSVITTKIKTKLAAEHFASTTQLKVDTDNAGVVWLSGSAPSQAEADKAVAIARGTEGVTAVKSEIVIKPK